MGMWRVVMSCEGTMRGFMRVGFMRDEGIRAREVRGTGETGSGGSGGSREREMVN